MLLLRAIGLLLILAIAICVGAWILTGRAYYLQWSKRLLQYGVAAAVVFMALLLLERLLAPVL